jgi:hypothetical protein
MAAVESFNRTTPQYGDFQKHRAGAKVVVVLLIEERGGLLHHSATAKE